MSHESVPAMRDLRRAAQPWQLWWSPEQSRHFILVGSAHCMSCFRGYVHPAVPCPNCHGTGKKQHGKKIVNCHTCSGFDHTVIDQSRWIPCTQCQGDPRFATQGHITDPLPKPLQSTIIERISLVIVREDRGLTANERLLGYRIIFSASNVPMERYTDDDLLDRVRERLTNGYLQACAIATDHGWLTPAIGIFTARYGYSVRALWGVDIGPTQQTIHIEQLGLLGNVDHSLGVMSQQARDLKRAMPIDPPIVGTPNILIAEAWTPV